MKYIASFVRKSLYTDFCLPELISICEMFNIPLQYDNNFSYDVDLDPLIRIEIPGMESNENAQKICDRAVLTKNIIKIYSEGRSYEELIANVDKNEFFEESDSSESFKFDIDARGKIMSQEQKVEVIEMFDGFNFQGKVEMKNMKRVFIVIDNHHRGVKYFGRLIAGRSEEDAKFYSKYNLDTRKYLGPTSTDNVLGFIMCNLAKVMPSDAVLDPFVGTGSLLIPPSHFKAMTVGCDIDMRVLKGYGIGYTKPAKKNGKVTRESDIFTNFINYNFPLPQILRSDINHPCFRLSQFFDSIICDPPYGHRAFSRKTGMEDEKKVKRVARLRKKYGKLLNEKYLVEEYNDESSDKLDEMKDDVCIKDDQAQVDTYFFSPLKQCSIEHIFENLLHIGNLTVKRGGILVCLYPTKKSKEEEE